VPGNSLTINQQNLFTPLRLTTSHIRFSFGNKMLAMHIKISRMEAGLQLLAPVTANAPYEASLRDA
jgi:hypothetical protein